MARRILGLEPLAWLHIAAIAVVLACAVVATLYPGMSELRMRSEEVDCFYSKAGYPTRVGRTVLCNEFPND